MPSNDQLGILVISLKSDTERRELLRRRFPERFPDFQFIDAIDLRSPGEAKKFEIPPPCRELRRNPLSPAEIGCALSHMEALALASKSGNRSTLILEDDVIGDDGSIEIIRQTLPDLPLHHMLLCGGQNGLRGRKYLYGTPESSYYRLPRLVQQFTARACSYAVSPSMASIILNLQSSCLHRADDWYRLLRGSKNVLFKEVMDHPTDLRMSHIEKERMEFPSPFSIKRIYADGIIRTTAKQATKAWLPIIAKFMKWRRIPLDKDQPSNSLET